MLKIFPLIICLVAPTLSFSFNDTKLESRPIRYAGSDDELHMQLNEQAEEIKLLKNQLRLLEEKLHSLNADGNVTIKNAETIPHPDEIKNKEINTTNSDVSEFEDDIFNVAKNIKEKPVSKDLKPQVKASSTLDKQLYDEAFTNFKEGKLTEAETKFNHFLTTYPKSLMGSNVYYWLGEISLKKKLYEKSAISYLKGYKSFPKGVKAADSLLKLSQVLGEIKKKDEACLMLAKLDTEFPSRPAASLKRAQDLKLKYNCK